MPREFDNDREPNTGVVSEENADAPREPNTLEAADSGGDREPNTGAVREPNTGPE